MIFEFLEHTAPRAPSGEIDWGMTGCVGTLVVVAILVAALVVALVLIAGAQERKAVARRAALATTLAAQTEAQARMLRAAEAERQYVRQTDLTNRFGYEIASRILAQQIWLGQTQEMLFEARGHPVATEERVLKTKTRHVHKFDWISGRRYALRVTLENGVVVGWDDKQAGGDWGELT
jgi:hypothetical protein